MRNVLLTATLAGLAFCAAAETADRPRNPFWPIGYDGVRYPIAAEPRFRPKPKAEVAVTNAPSRKADESARESEKARAAAKKAEDKMWTEALKALDFGSAFRFCSSGRTSATATINGRCYGIGDLISENVGDRRFTWSVEAISSDGKMKLKRLQHRPLRKNEQP